MMAQPRPNLISLYQSIGTGTDVGDGTKLNVDFIVGNSNGINNSAVNGNDQF